MNRLSLELLTSIPTIFHNSDVILPQFDPESQKLTWHHIWRRYCWIFYVVHFVNISDWKYVKICREVFVRYCYFNLRRIPVAVCPCKMGGGLQEYLCIFMLPSQCSPYLSSISPQSPLFPCSSTVSPSPTMCPWFIPPFIPQYIRLD